MREITWNSKIAKKRGKAWRDKLVSGRLDAALHPSKLRMLRVQKGLSQDAVAKKLGVPLSTYGSIERGNLTVKNPTAVKLSSILKAPAGALFKKSGTKLVAVK
jgi:DNA-binding XRE family transcriptional regulator